MTAKSNVVQQTIIATWVLLMASTTGFSQARSPAEQRGQTFLRTHCVRCHSIDKLTPSPLTAAPPFRDLHLRYPVESLEEALGEGIRTGHPSMPEFQLDPGQVRDVIAYLKSLER